MAVATQSTSRDYRFEYVRVADVKIDPLYHPPERFSERHLAKLGPFDESKVGVITCSNRAAQLWLLDGNHRRALAIKAGVEYLYAKVFFGKTQAEEAAIFHGLSRQLPLQGFDLWQTRRVEQDPIVLGVEATLAKYGARIARGASGSASATRSVITLERIYVAEADLLDQVVSMVRTVWPDEKRALDALPLQAIASFIFIYSRTIPQMDARSLANRLSVITPEEIYQAERTQRAAEDGRFGTGRAGPGGSATSVGVLGWSYARRAVLAVYNRRRSHKHRLPDLRIGDLRRITAGETVDLRDRE